MPCRCHLLRRPAFQVDFRLPTLLQHRREVRRFRLYLFLKCLDLGLNGLWTFSVDFHVDGKIVDRLMNEEAVGLLRIRVTVTQWRC